MNRHVFTINYFKIRYTGMPMQAPIDKISNDIIFVEFS